MGFNELRPNGLPWPTKGCGSCTKTTFRNRPKNVLKIQIKASVPKKIKQKNKKMK
jgi:hypothetical protein